jgi:hypothetical protein
MIPMGAIAANLLRGTGGTTLVKVEVTATRGGGFVQIAEMTAHASEGGPAVGGVTYTATETNGSNVASNMASGAAGVWQATSATADVEMTVPSATVEEIVIICGGAFSTDAPLNFNIYFWSGGSWVLQKAVAGAPYRANSDTLRFPIGRTYAASEASRWMLKINSTQSGGFPSLRELEFRTVAGSSASDISTTTHAVSGTTSLGTTGATAGFDNTTAAQLGLGGAAPRWIGCTCSAPGAVVEIAYWNAAGAGDSFKDVDVRYWDSETFALQWNYIGAAMVANSSRIDTKP